MNRPFALISAAAVLGTAVVLLTAPRSTAKHSRPPTASAEGAKLLTRLPCAFVPNVGQWEHSALFVAKVRGMTVFLEEKGWTFTLCDRTAERTGDTTPSVRSVAVRMTLSGADAPQLTAEGRLAGHHNYFLGDDPSRWRSDVPLYRSVCYRGVHPGIDVRARDHDGRFEYDLLLQPEADLGSVEIVVQGIERMHLDHAGDLVLETQLGPVRMPVPLSWEEGPSGVRSPVMCNYVLRGGDRFGFEVAKRRPGWALTVDPGLVWSTFLGGTSTEAVNGLAVDGQGATTVVGLTESTTFPTTAGSFDRNHNGSSDVFVTRIAASGTALVYSTFLGGSSNDCAYALALDAEGVATIVGDTGSHDFPTTAGAFDTTPNSGFDAFVTRLSATGSGLVYSTYLGGIDGDFAYAVALDSQGATTVAGVTVSTNFPTTAGALDQSHNGAGDGFITRLSPTGASLVFSTFLGGAGGDQVLALALDTQGAATVAGITSSSGFPTTPSAFDTSFNGADDAFVTTLSSTGSSLIYSTFLGGTANDRATAVALDPSGSATVAGWTSSIGFPTTSGVFDPTFNGLDDTFVTRISPSGSNLLFSTFLGGTTADRARAIALDPQGAVTVVGYTNSTTFPTTPGAFDTSDNGGGDAFVSRLSPAGSTLLYSTFLGGTNLWDQAHALAIDAQGAATVAGYAVSPSFPTTPAAFDTTHNGGYDGFVTRLDMLPAGVTAYGRSTAGCRGSLAISVTSIPRIGNSAFALTCGNAPPNTTGLLALTANRFTVPFVVLGAELWVDPTLAFVQLPASSDSIGASEALLPIANDPTLPGARLFAQFFWAGPTSPPPCPPSGLSASHALEITIQP